MATKTTRKSGENHSVTFGTAALGTARTTQVQLSIRTADARGSGDAAPVDKEIGLANGRVQCAYLITDETTLALLGTYDTLVLKDSAGTTVFSATCLFEGLQRRDSFDEMTVIDASFTVQSVPTVPDLSHLAYA